MANDHNISMQDFTATYSPEDNKLRLYASSRLDEATYSQVKANGFIWAPKQGLFVAPMWTPQREDLLIELAGEIGDEDISLVDRAEQRAERFEEYSDKREDDAIRAKKSVDAICDGIPLGQPILVGHHSERRARKDAERIENGMRRAVKMWETAQYWTARAAGAIRAAKYKERPDVRARRIKAIEADLRKVEKNLESAQLRTKLWVDAGPELTHGKARALANLDGYDGTCYPLKDFPRNPPVSQYEGAMGAWSALGDTPELGIITPAQAREQRIRQISSYIPHGERWKQHYENRLAYERAMLADSGGLRADSFDVQVGGQIQRRGEWLVVTKLNKRGGKITSVTVAGHFLSTVQAEEIQDYRPPAEGDAEKVAAATRQAPLCNFRSEGCIEMTSDEWKRKNGCTDAFAVRRFNAQGEYSYKGTAYRHRTYYRMGNGTVTPVFLTDAKVVPAPTVPAEKPPLPQRHAREESPRMPVTASEPTEFEAMKETLRQGVQVVSAPQLFPTPPELARRMVQLAKVEPGECVLEPSAGTGNIVRAVVDAVDTEVLAYEINPTLCTKLRGMFPSYRAHVECRDFLQVTEHQGCYPVVLMNPPFSNADDIKHIQHARKFVKPGGVLVAICANGPRQQAALKPIADYWEALPEETFRESGTLVNAALLVIRVAQ